MIVKELIKLLNELVSKDERYNNFIVSWDTDLDYMPNDSSVYSIEVFTKANFISLGSKIDYIRDEKTQKLTESFCVKGLCFNNYEWMTDLEYDDESRQE